MNNKLKIIIKNIWTYINHPFISPALILKNVTNFYIGPQMTINNIKGLHMGNNVYIGRNSRFLIVNEYKGSHYNPSIRIGNNVTIGNRFSALSAAPIVISDNCLIASDVFISSENHGTNPELGESYADIPLCVSPVLIGEGCWIGEKACILPGVSLGRRCIVATGAVVTKSFPDNSMIAGVPARLIKTYNYITHEWEKVGE